MNTPENSELLPICTLSAILCGFMAYLVFAPEVLPCVIAAGIGAIIGLGIASLEDPPSRRAPNEPEEDSFSHWLTHDSR